MAAPHTTPRLAGVPSTAFASRLAPPRPLCRNRLKRVVDVAGALALLVLFGGVMAVIAVLVRMDGGPAVFGHRRVGTDGRPFTCWKFRSMVTDAHEVFADLMRRDPQARAEWAATHKLKDDPRITRVGRFLRRTSLDELPQLFNVLKGEMSLVGPRPIVDDEVARYRTCFAVYTQCRPGLTGLWQVSGRSDVDYGRRVQLDTAYVFGWSFWGDIAIMLKTARVMVSGRGAY